MKKLLLKRNSDRYFPVHFVKLFIFQSTFFQDKFGWFFVKCWSCGCLQMFFKVGASKISQISQENTYVAALKLQADNWRSEDL